MKESTVNEVLNVVLNEAINVEELKQMMKTFFIKQYVLEQKTNEINEKLEHILDNMQCV